MENVFNLSQIIPRAANLYPNTIAYRYMNQQMSYQELDEKTNQLAHYFVENGLTKGDRVGIFLPRCIETPIAIYAILKAGGVFVPLDINMPHARLVHIVQDCQIEFIITQKNATSKIESLVGNIHEDIHTIGLEDGIFPERHKNISWNGVFGSGNKAPIDIKIAANDLAYIMYTSGTTGNPKGIVHTHYSGLSYAKLSLQQYTVDKNDTIANHSPLHFDISTFGYLTSPLAGATTVIISEAHTKFPLSLAQLIKKENITIWYSVPVALMQLTNLPMFRDLEIHSVRWVLFGGESYPTKQLLNLMEIWPNAQYSNVYGPAEVNQCSYYTVPKDIDEDTPIPLGYIWPDTEMLILDDEDREMKNGEIGKLLISSSTMMFGYWNNDELTERGFYHHRENRLKNFFKKYYRTGDLVHQDEKGILHFHGRGDRQIKTRGYRVELNEVENVLLNIPEIKHAAVFSYKDDALGKLIGASVVVYPESTIEKQKIKAILTNTLPKYCIPESINFVREIKRTSAGKIDYKSLASNFQ